MLEWSLSHSLITLLQQRQQLQRWFRIFGARDARRRRGTTRRGECEIGDGVLGDETATHSWFVDEENVKRWEIWGYCYVWMFLVFFWHFLWLEASFPCAEPTTRNKGFFWRNFSLGSHSGDPSIHRETMWKNWWSSFTKYLAKFIKYEAIYQPNMKFKIFFFILFLYIWLHTGNQI